MTPQLGDLVRISNAHPFYSSKGITTESIGKILAVTRSSFPGRFIVTVSYTPPNTLVVSYYDELTRLSYSPTEALCHRARIAERLGYLVTE